jgi:hypothetical protein
MNACATEIYLWDELHPQIGLKAVQPRLATLASKRAGKESANETRWVISMLGVIVMIRGIFWQNREGVSAKLLG